MQFAATVLNVVKNLFSCAVIASGVFLTGFCFNVSFLLYDNFIHRRMADALNGVPVSTYSISPAANKTQHMVVISATYFANESSR